MQTSCELRASSRSPNNSRTELTPRNLDKPTSSCVLQRFRILGNMTNHKHAYEIIHKHTKNKHTLQHIGNIFEHGPQVIFQNLRSVLLLVLSPNKLHIHHRGVWGYRCLPLNPCPNINIYIYTYVYIYVWFVTFVICVWVLWFQIFCTTVHDKVTSPPAE